MIPWFKYIGHEPDIQGKRKFFDNTIYTFDIETSSFFKLNGKIYQAKDYENLTKDEQENCEFYSNMYIWQFSINDLVYYGRTWQELKEFLYKIDNFVNNYQGKNIKKYCFIHNASYEFQFIRNGFEIESVFARKSRRLIKFELKDLNFEFRCSMMMSNCSLDKLANVYNLDVKKLNGFLNYDLLRNSKSVLSKNELDYCEHDCLVVYEYIKKELEKYEFVKYIPITSTGHVRKEFKEIIEKDYKYKNKVRKSVNTDGHIFNLLR